MQNLVAMGCTRLSNVMESSYIMGMVNMVAMNYKRKSKMMKNSLKCTKMGCFVLWQMMPNMWLVEMVLDDSEVHVASNVKIMWHHTPWLGSHLTKGPVRLLPRALKGMDPISIARLFANGMGDA
ncbi:hypothetical protein SUGI_0031060 [Cryptomeria japonica]|nr:hypothetical protein SUGI_0031060 [Cryptomeria japonica]